MPIDNSSAGALQAIPFSSLIGGPLSACIEAQAKAAKTSWEFIQNAGFTPDPETGTRKAVNVSFQYDKNGETVNLIVPLLTIVPVPFLVIDQVIIDFNANIPASTSNENSSIDNPETQTTANTPQAIPFSSLIGSPLNAVAQAQAQAAEAHLEFIQNAALTSNHETGEEKAVNVTFHFDNNEMAKLTAPLLTTVPTPLQTITRVTIDFQNK